MSVSERKKAHLRRLTARLGLEAWSAPSKVSLETPYAFTGSTSAASVYGGDVPSYT